MFQSCGKTYFKHKEIVHDVIELFLALKEEEESCPLVNEEHLGEVLRGNDNCLRKVYKTEFLPVFHFLDECFLH